MTPDQLRQAANAERFMVDDDPVLLFRLRAVIHGVSLAALFVSITVYRILGDI